MTDQDLRRRFEALRRAELDAARSFAATVHRLRPAVHPMRWLRVGALATLLLLTILPFATRRWSSTQQPPALSTWKAPTDFLLDTPGNEFLRSVPRLGPAAVPESLKGITR